MDYVKAILAILSIVKLILDRAQQARLKSEGASDAIGRIAQETLDDVRKMHELHTKTDAEFDAARVAGGMPSNIRYRD